MTEQGYTLRDLIKGNIKILIVSRIIWSLSMSIVTPYQSLYILDLGGSKPVIGLITALGNVAGMLFYPIGGYLADKSGRAKLVGYGTLMYASSFILFILAPSWGWIGVAMAFQQLVLFYMPALTALMADSIPPGARGKILSFTIAIPEAVKILAPFIGGWLILRMGRMPAMRAGYTLSLFMATVVAIMRIRYLQETIEQTRVERNIPKLFIESYRNLYTSIKWVLSNMKGYSIIGMLLIFIGSLVQPYWVVYGTEVTGLTDFQWGKIFLIAGIVKTVVSLYVGGIIDRVGPKKCMLFSFIVSAPAMLAFTYTKGFIDTVVVYLFLVLGNAFLWISSGVLLADTIPRQVRGRVMAGLGQGVCLGISGGGYAQGFILLIPNMLGSLISGYIYEVNPTYPWIINTLVLLGCLVLCFRLIKEPDVAEV